MLDGYTMYELLFGEKDDYPYARLFMDKHNLEESIPIEKTADTIAAVVINRPRISLYIALSALIVDVIKAAILFGGASVILHFLGM